MLSGTYLIVHKRTGWDILSIVGPEHLLNILEVWHRLGSWCRCWGCSCAGGCGSWLVGCCLGSLGLCTLESRESHIGPEKYGYTMGLKYEKKLIEI